MLHAILVLAAASVVAQHTAPAPKSAPAKTVEPPAGAVKIDSNTYRWKDSSGRSWMYRKTPFGWARIDETAEAEAERVAGTQSRAQKPVEIRAFDEGEIVRFEKQGPFGVYSWKRKKTELLPEETQALDKAQALKQAQK